jgi:uncharacterized membrane protein YheB (UPF0754 family)
MPDLSSPWVQLAINVAVGTVAGGITNAVAVWMLFHPYERRFGLHGAIPKNRARLAKSIGRTVGERLLTPGDIISELNRAGLRDSLDAKLAEFIATLLEREWGSLRTLLPPAVGAELERTLGGLGPTLAEGYVREVNSPEFEARVRGFVARARIEFAPLPMSAVLTPERRAELSSQAADLATDLIEEGREAGNRSARAKFGDLLLRLAGTDRTRTFVERTVHEALARAGSRSWGDVLAPLDDHTIVAWLLEAARSSRAAELAMTVAGGAAGAVLERPIGRVGRWLSDDAALRLAAVASPALWEWIVAQLPGFLETLDVESMVERKVLGFSTQRVEELVRNVTQRELDVIVRLGYVLGAVIGLATFAIGELIRRA